MSNLERLHQEMSTDEEYRRAYAEEDLIHRVAARTYKLRKLRGWSQAELAERLGTQQPAIARLEGGFDNLTLRRLAALAHVLECDPEDLVSRTFDPHTFLERRFEGFQEVLVNQLRLSAGPQSVEADRLVPAA